MMMAMTMQPQPRPPCYLHQWHDLHHVDDNNVQHHLRQHEDNYNYLLELQTDCYGLFTYLHKHKVHYTVELLLP